MSLSQDDKDNLRLMIKDAVSEAIQPIGRMVEMHETTIFGPKGDTGMFKDVTCIKENVKKITLKIAWISGAVSTAVVAGQWLLKKIN